ncbi:hypothetical protein V8G54_032835 [Vigna mungo]|uniref:Uncharacterized protein n=1 Tax=Vigna mungo TaxID=3915 RepID=A0AAQ3RIB3_VIGMU
MINYEVVNHLPYDINHYVFSLINQSGLKQRLLCYAASGSNYSCRSRVIMFLKLIFLDSWYRRINKLIVKDQLIMFHFLTLLSWLRMLVTESNIGFFPSLNISEIYLNISMSRL